MTSALTPVAEPATNSATSRGGPSVRGLCLPILSAAVDATFPCRAIALALKPRNVVAAR